MFQLSKTQLQAYKFSEEQINALFNPDPHLIENSLNWLNSASDKHIICYDDARYPRQLKEISSPPLLLYMHGDLSLLGSPQIAMVGSRSCTPYGREKAYQFAGQLSEAGFTITSGLAVGIDGLAHQGALDKQGRTIAVLGTGLNNIYPKRHARLAQQIIEQGLLISEFRPDTAAYPANFPRRNRIISGLSLGVVVIEASKRSGSLITARYALEQNREVFALPGSIDNSEACGCHQLIQQGAKLVVNSQDICEEFLHLPLNNTTTAQVENKNEEAHPLLKYIDFHLTTLEQLLNRSALDIVSLQNQLIELEITGRIRVTAEGYIKLKS
ncbi:DNA-processing protein DprA [Psychromonas aquimarina]|uniref:DNA-processing protein DprA n=1 Tax=Psychromonas aquimarina TaxID=444919 RepID=UPI0003FF4F3E|nr:DNA-processing protein DprA [Psychromonas aquimarina]